MNISPQVEQTLNILQQNFSDSLIAVYLHGSSVSTGLKPTSDLDILVVLNKAINKEIRQQIVHHLMDISGLYPRDPKGRRPLEVAFFLMQELENLSYPAPCELIYGEWLRDDFERGQFDGKISDPEFTLMLAQAQQDSMSLWQIETYSLPVIAIQQVRQAILDALPNLLSSIAGDERNVILTLARMWYTMRTGLFTSKDQAASWAIDILPAKITPILINAKESYLSGLSINWQKKQTELSQFIDYMELCIRESF